MNAFNRAEKHSSRNRQKEERRRIRNFTHSVVWWNIFRACLLYDDE